MIRWYKRATGFESVNEQRSSRHQAYLDFLAPRLNTSWRILSIACGNAWTERALQPQLDTLILCTDLRPAKMTILYFDALHSPLLPDKFDAILCLSFIYQLNDEQLVLFLMRVRKMLKPNGILFLDSAGPAPSLLVWCWNHLYIALENAVAGVLQWTPTNWTHHGFWRSDRELREAVETVGICRVSITPLDPHTELSRSRLYRRVLSRFALGRWLGEWLGRQIPYVRMVTVQWEHPQVRKRKDETC